MDTKGVYETCGEIGGALSMTKRQVFADALIRLIGGQPPIMGTTTALSRWLPDTVRPSLLPLFGTLRTRNPGPAAAARRWLRDAGWL